MKSINILTSTAAALSLCSFAPASLIVDTDQSNFQAGGTTFTIEGNEAAFPGAGKYASIDTSGTDGTVVLVANPSPTDFYFNLDAADIGASKAVSTYRYVEVFYSLNEAWTGSTHQLRLNSTGTSANFDTPFNNTAAIPSSAGDHSILIDLTSDDGTTLNGRWTGDWNTLRLDFFNNAGNGGNTFTLDKVVYGSEAVSVIPEPTALALVAFGLGMLGLRRKHR